MYHGQWEAAELLISQGATPFLSPNNYWIVQDVWDYIAYTSLIDVCVPHFTITYEALCMTASNWHLELLRICQNLGQSEALNFTRVHRSVTKWSSELLDGIENLRDQVDDTDSFGRTPLYWAATLGSAETLETLLLNGANPQLSDFNGSTPLHRAASTGCITSIKYLLRSGAEIDARDRHGFTPLTYACAQGQAEAIDFFLQHGVSIDSTNYVGETPIYMATHAKRPEVVQLLAERGASLEWSDKWGYDPLLDAVVLDSHEALTYLLSLNHRPDVRIFDGKNIFHIAALNSNFETVEILLRANITNVDPNALDDAGFRPLQYLRKRPGAEHLLEPFCALLLQADKSYPYGLDRIDEQDNIFFDAKEVQ
jgi:ankyrin repeat protein